MPFGTQEIQPQSIGQILDDTFRSLRQFARPLAVATLSIYLPYLVVEDIFTVQSSNALGGLENVQSFNEVMAYLQSAMPHIVAVVLWSMVGVLLVVPLLYATVVHLLIRAADHGEPPTFSDVFPLAWRRTLALIGTTLFKWLALFLVFLISGGIIALMIGLLAAFGASALVAGIVAAVLSVIAVVLYVWLMLKWVMSIPAVAAEGRVGFGALRASSDLVRHSVWRVLGFFIIVELIAAAVNVGLTALFRLLPNAVAASVLDSLVQLLTVPFTLVAATKLYMDLRVRRDARENG
ncbi:hypothetical protein GCM10025857_30620 [Alicyclobacillus contaminans]|uniref:hypothetical protein n=1 Tax=Alicyclobacillus contaminans TaxID=392016 RepID=UPI00040D70CD|nr:hypothetical protein [Alicyclobacillus contaminans]GMA51705.1 hypothetical protein GCM10025857_30620 [Alicyclobacillus contaminans]